VASTSDTEPTERGILGRDVGVFFVTSYHCSPPDAAKEVLFRVVTSQVVLYSLKFTPSPKLHID
jgi:hypothetical protein